MSDVPIIVGVPKSQKLRCLANEMRANASQTEQAIYSEKLRKAADELDVRAELLEQPSRINI
jgi:hypothetical protein